MLDRLMRIRIHTTPKDTSALYQKCRAASALSVNNQIHYNQGGNHLWVCMANGAAYLDSVCVQVTYSLELAQQYMWAQSDHHIFLAVHVPTGQCSKYTSAIQKHHLPELVLWWPAM